MRAKLERVFSIRRLTGILALVGLMTAGHARAAIYYVSPDGANAKTGVNWDNAYSVAELQTAISACTSSGDEIRLRYGTYTNNAQLSISSLPGLTLCGGYLGIGETFTNTATVLTRNPATNMRIVYGASSTFTLDRVTVSGGRVQNGAGLYLSSCAATLTNCTVQANVNYAGSSTFYGAGIYASDGSLTVVDSTIRANANAAESTHKGIGVYAANAVVSFLRVTVAEHTTVYGNSYAYGGGMHLTGGSAWIEDCVFEGNRLKNNRDGYGGAIYATAVGPITVTNCVFEGNGANARYNTGARGGALYVTGCNPAHITDCSFSDNLITSSGTALSREGADLWLAGSGIVSDCTISGANFGSVASESVYIDTVDTWLIQNTAIQGGLGTGVRKRGTGRVVLTNCLVTGYSAHGILVADGTGIVAQCTIANNGGWGMTNSSAVVTMTMTDSIIWGNALGGIQSGTGTVTYTCAQEAHTGDGNTSVDPLWIAGYYLSVAGLLYQGADSPCIGVGSTTVGAAGMDARTTRTDGAFDTITVDLGYHASAGVSTSLSNLVLYVDVVNGNNANDGWSDGAAVSNLTEALARAIDGSTIHIAAGLYDLAAGETFPLNMAVPNLTLKADDPDTTIVDAGAGSERGITVSGQGSVWIEGMTIRNGRATVGAGIFLPNCQATVTNCIVTGNRCNSSNSKGGGIFAGGGMLTVVDTRLTDNGRWGSESVLNGGALYTENGTALTLRRVTVFDNGVNQANSYLYGAGLHLNGGSAWIEACNFTNNMPNYSNGRTWQGGAVYATGVDPLTFTNCTFRLNRMRGSGAGLYIVSSGFTRVLNCFFDRNYLVTGSNGGPEGSAMWLSGSGLISDCVFEGSTLDVSPETIFLSNALGTSWLVRNTEMRGGVGIGVRKQGAGELVLTNCLINSYASHGVFMEAGTGTVAQCTLADNGGWGLTNSATPVDVRDSIAWGNASGGIAASSGTVSYTCSQETQTGAGNTNADPLWIAGYYLSVAGEPSQPTDSPCIDAGSTTAETANMDSRTTRTDGAFDTTTVDMGFHLLTGSTELANLTLYVNAVTGDDGNDGWSAVGDSLKTITTALSRALNGSTIHVATGLYDTALGEVFPLDFADPNLSLKGTDPDTTIVDAGGAARVFAASGAGAVWVQGMTVQNGLAATGAGLYLPNCQATVTNCVFTGNRCNSSTSKGGGIYAVAGMLTVVDSRFQDNGQWGTESTLYGGALCAESGISLTLKRVTVSGNNSLQNNSTLYGAGLYLNGGSAWIEACDFTNNMPMYSNGRTWQGGALYATGVNPLTITNCLFQGNRMRGAGAGAYIVSSGSTRILNCLFDGNTLASGNSAMEGAALRLSGSGLISDCVVIGTNTESALEDVYINNTAGSSWALWNTVLHEGRAIGLNKLGTGSVGMTNCLVHSSGSDGVVAGAGMVSLANSTFAHNGGWGVSVSSASVTSLNSIAWGNTSGGFETGTLSYTCSQEIHPGANNTVTDPQFADVATNNFRLMRRSPCVESGFEENWMLTALDLAGNPRVNGKTVDLGPYEEQDPPISGTIISFR